MSVESLHVMTAIITATVAGVVVGVGILIKLAPLVRSVREIKEEWAANRRVGPEKDKTAQANTAALVASISALKAEILAALEQRLGVTERLYAELAKRMESAESTIKELAILIKVQP